MERPQPVQQGVTTLSQHQFPTPMESFSWLTESIPEWQEKLEGLLTQVRARQEEFEKMSVALRGSSRLRKMKTGSTESLRPQEKDDGNPFEVEVPLTLPTDTAITTPTTPVPKLEVDPHNRRLFQEYREAAAQRKRKSRSVHSGTSGPAKFRTRTSTVVYYDSDVQAGFESMVRCLASARNTLRKGKNATSYKARMASLAEEESPFDGNRSKVALRNPRIARFGKSSSPFSMDSLSLEQFDVIDKELEIAQTLCEIGAHQFLRDPQSTEELHGVNEKLGLCLKLAQEGQDMMKTIQKDVDQHQMEAPPAIKQDTGTRPDTGSSEPKDYTDSAMGIEIDDGIVVEVDNEDEISVDIPGYEPGSEISASGESDSKKALHQIHQLTDAQLKKPEPQQLAIGADLIEIDGDDSDRESFHVDLSTIRRAR